MRRTYKQAQLLESDINTDPIAQFAQWFAQARETQDDQEANAMVLATVGPDGAPSARVVLLKAILHGRFTFYTNLDSQKGQELRANPRAALVFFWPWLEQQVRVTGHAALLDRDTVRTYFQSRPRASQIGAHTSPQSQIINSRESLTQRKTHFTRQFAGQDRITPPERWGGFAVTPEQIEFWQGRPGRLHDRLRYVRAADGWRLERLAP